jgi:predicted ATPase
MMVMGQSEQHSIATSPYCKMPQRIELTIKNYRCFDDSNPVHLSIERNATAFIGPNNSGKSSLLRFFVEFRDIFARLASIEGVMSAASKQGLAAQAITVSDAEEVFCYKNARNLTIELRLSSCVDAYNRLRIVYDRQSKATFLTMMKESGEEIVVTGREENVLKFGNDAPSTLTDVLEMFQILSSTLYVPSFRNALPVEAKLAYYDIQVGRQLVARWREMQTGNDRRDNERIDDLTETIQNIFGFNKFSINPSSDGNTFQMMIDGRSYRLNEVGAGLAHFIIVLGNLIANSPELLLIDEPELGLHPTLQLDFLTTISSYASFGTLFATHSIGLARSAGDTVYSVRKANDGAHQVRLYEETPYLPEFVGEMNFSGYRELGFEQILLIEGSTEVKTIQQFLRARRKDHRIVLIELGGASMINGKRQHELEEILRITTKVGALIDSERSIAGEALSKERREFADLCQRLGIGCHVLDRRATENYLTEAAIQEVKGVKYRALRAFENREAVQPQWAKAENWRIARKMSKEDLDGSDLGEFLDKL